jgi:host factor-I protein
LTIGERLLEDGWPYPEACSQTSIFIIPQSNRALELLSKIIYVIKRAPVRPACFLPYIMHCRKTFFGERRSEESMPENRNQNLQDLFLNQLRKDRIPVVMFLTNGVRLKGIIKGFDNFVVLLKDVTDQLIYKHAISTIVPEKNVEIKVESSEKQ